MNRNSGYWSISASTEEYVRPILRHVSPIVHSHAVSMCECPTTQPMSLVMFQTTLGLTLAYAVGTGAGGGRGGGKYFLPGSEDNVSGTMDPKHIADREM